jgi:DNA-directed RNA polymerase subunit RPC12/RpoP
VTPDLARCVRCGKQEPFTYDADLTRWPPEGWEETVGLVCPGCQYAAWHPYCESIVDGDGNRVKRKELLRLFARRRELEEQLRQGEDGPALADEYDAALVEQCGYVDLTVSWFTEEKPPKGWRCPKCGGKKFVGIHRSEIA